MNIKKIVIGSSAAAALGIAALTGAGTAHAAVTAPVATTQSSIVQRGNQSTPDTGASAEAVGNETDVSDGPGGHADTAGVDVQQGDQSAPDTGASAEKAGNETGVSDGPGGHADAAGSNVDYQFDGNE